MSVSASAAVSRVPVTHEGLTHIANNLRARDRAEIFALRWDDDPANLVAGMLPFCKQMTWIWELDGVPVSIQGAVPMRPGVWDVFAFGTDQWPRVVLPMTKHARRFIIPALLRVNFHRAECRALASHTDSRRWITALGAHEEAILKGYGRSGEDFVGYVWRPEDVRRWV